ncbi:Flp pilus assembly protein CpaB [Sphingobium sp. H39-3-25]|uniref:Flp pilus assembly protein CpaB n=1 Tax=Sphingobium arseniciresistens TaxID=3030834 RepID=UPI0023B9ABE8|nr:Flp pilus assembly protein CpaB [Sphingobium arseniciresistens]
MIIFGLAILLGLAAVYIANAYLVRKEQLQAQVPQGMAKVVVARVAMPFGTAVTNENVRVVDWPAASLPAGSFHSPAQLTSFGKTRVVTRAIEANEPVLAAKLSGDDGRASITGLLRPDMRATAVRVSDVAAAGGFVLPGDTVDVLVTRQLEGAMGGKSEQITDVLLQGVRVIAIDQNANDSTKDPTVGKTATLETNQVDAQKLVLGQSVGQLTLVLRKITDKPTLAVQTVDIEDLRDGAYVGGYRRSSVPPALAGLPADMSVAPAPAAWRPRPVAARPAAPSNTATIEVVRGTKGSSYEVKRYGTK